MSTDSEGIRSQLTFSGISSCVEFVQNKFKPEKCANCSLLVGEHKSEAVSDEMVLLALKAQSSKDPGNHVWTHENGGKLYLGGFMASTPSFCDPHQITHICNTAKDLDKFYVAWAKNQLQQLHQRPNVHFHQVGWVDSTLQSLGNNYDVLINAIHFLENGLAAGQNCLVHCAQGKSRSSTVVIGYLMAKTGSDFNTCEIMVRNKRAIIEPNEYFIKQLKEFHTSPEISQLRKNLMKKDCNQN